MLRINNKSVYTNLYKISSRPFLKNNEIAEANFMRIGKKEQWRQELSEKQKEMFKQILTKELTQFAYPVNDDI